MRSSFNHGQAAVFLDRDGTINVDKGHVHRIEDWEWLPGAVDGIRSLNELRLPVIVITNQAGVARGYYDEAAINALHAHVDAELARQGARIDAYYYCPHHPEYGPACECRKPQPGMLLRACNEHGLDLGRSFMIGDKLSDAAAASAVGVQPLMVETGYGSCEAAAAEPRLKTFKGILDAVRFIAGAEPARA